MLSILSHLLSPPLYVTLPTDYLSLNAASLCELDSAVDASTFDA